MIARYRRLIVLCSFVLSQPLARTSEPIASRQQKPKVIAEQAVSYALASQTAWVDVPNVTLQISTNGHPVCVGIVPEQVDRMQPFSVISSADSIWSISIVRDGTTIGSFNSLGVRTNFSAVTLPLSMTTIDLPSKGIHTYTLKAQAPLGGFTIQGARLVVFEML
jgi:hypothetical protein